MRSTVPPVITALRGEVDTGSPSGNATKQESSAQPRTRSRNMASLVLFGRSAMTTLAVVSGGLGFMAGIQASSATYDPHSYAIGVGALFAAACTVIAFLLMRRRKDKAERRSLVMRLEELADRNWQLREAERGVAEARDAAQAASQAKSRFLAMVSHEIRTPLNGLLGMADLLLDTPLSPEQLTYTKAAKASGEALLSLIEEVLDFSKIEAGKLDLDPQPFDLVPLVEEAVELLAVRAHVKGIEIASFVDDRLPARFIGDAARLRQVLLNLAGNAVKFTEHGGVAVVVEPGDGGHGLCFIVRDTGIGLRAEDQARIFLDFEQADGSSTRPFGGTGLGLAISKRIVERMAGSIDVDSKPGQGATFRFSVPLPAATDSGRAGVEPPDLSGQAALIVAATEIEASLLARRLGRWGAQTCAVTDETMARALLPERLWHTLLVDFPLARKMIDNGGLAAHGGPRRIVLIRPGDRHQLPALKAAGFTDYLVKPVRSVSLAARLTVRSAFEQALADGVDDINRSTADRATLEKAVDDAVIDKKANGLAVLVAEDNEINALLVRTMLTRLGHRPTIVGDGAAAVSAWRTAESTNTPFDLVLMDVQMPGLNGLEAARQIRAVEAERPEAPPAPIMALTANADSEDRAACLAAGMDGLLVKPLNAERLRDVLQAVAGKATLAA